MSCGVSAALRLGMPSAQIKHTIFGDLSQQFASVPVCVRFLLLVVLRRLAVFSRLRCRLPLAHLSDGLEITEDVAVPL